MRVLTLEEMELVAGGSGCKKSKKPKGGDCSGSGRVARVVVQVVVRVVVRVVVVVLAAPPPPPPPPPPPVIRLRRYEVREHEKRPVKGLFSWLIRFYLVISIRPEATSKRSLACAWLSSAWVSWERALDSAVCVASSSRIEPTPDL